MKVTVTQKERKTFLLLTLLIAIVLFIWDLGSTGLVDETPPLFAAAGRAMSSTGDWLTPRVNGLPRFDKPPLIYWLMGFFYSLPGQELWDPLGTWAGRLPSAIASITLMLFLVDTLLCHPQRDCSSKKLTALTTGLAFALSPLVIIWSRIAVSDALLCATFGISMLLQWRRYVNPRNHSWSLPWVVLGLSVLTKGPVSLVLMGLTFLFFGLHQRNISEIILRLRPIRGLLLTTIVAIPWYLIEYLVEGKPFWDSFFGYHNFQRFTTVVNSHMEPWWFFGCILILASLPFTSYLLHGFVNELFPRLKLNNKYRNNNKSENSLGLFAAYWLISVLLLFTCAATKLPSYWLPATPAAAILIGISSNYYWQSNRKIGLFNWIISVLLILILAIIFWTAPSWILSVNDPEIPNLGKEILFSGLLVKGAICLSICSFVGLLFSFRYGPGRLLLLQIPWLFSCLIVVLPVLRLGDNLRQLPLRKVAALLVINQKENEPLAMVGALKPSIHFYTKKIILYEGRSAGSLVNLSERLSDEVRQGWIGRSIKDPKYSPTVLIVIDKKTSNRTYWKGLRPKQIGAFGIYKVWRLDRYKLERRAKNIINKGIKPDWQLFRPERF